MTMKANKKIKVDKKPINGMPDGYVMRNGRFILLSGVLSRLQVGSMKKDKESA